MLKNLLRVTCHCDIVFSSEEIETGEVLEERVKMAGFCKRV